MGQEQRRAARRDVSLPVAGRMPATPIYATLVNLSQSGLMAETADCDVKVGVTMLLELDADTAISGQVVWIENTRFGLEFHTPIDAGTVDRIAAGNSRAGEDAIAITDKFGRKLPELGNGVALRLHPAGKAEGRRSERNGT